MTLPTHELRRLTAVATDEGDLERLIRRRIDGEPLQYLEGTAAFGPYELMVDERVLIPRPETEQLWELATRAVTNPAVIVDLCTGSGALAIALSGSFPRARVVATDISRDALAVAQENASRTGCDVELRAGDLFEAVPAELEGVVDLLVSNPPYVSEAEYRHVPPDVRREPRGALVAGPSGLEVLERIAGGLARWMRPGGSFVIEIAETQGGAARELFAAFGATVRRDLTGRDRFVTGTA